MALTAAPSLREQLALALALDNNRLFAAVLVLSLAPLWLGRYLPLIDLPQHAAQIGALREIWAGNEVMAALFRVNWFTPYLLGYLLLYALALVLPITVATQALVSVSVVAIPLLTGRLLRAAGADERWKWLAIPCSFGFAVYWGFLSFIVAAPLALLFLIRTINFVKQPTVRNGATIALFAILLFFCHIIVLGFASLIALGYVAGVHYRNLKALVLHALPYAAPLPLIGVWFAVTYDNEARVQNDPVAFGPWSYRLLNLLTQPAGREDLSGSAALIVLVVTATVLLLPWLSGASFSRRPERWLPFSLGLLVFLGAPHYVFSTAYFYQRLGLFLVPLWLMAWDPPQRRRLIERVAIPLVVLWVMANIGRFSAFARETESFTALMNEMEPGRRVAAMVYDARTPLFGLPIYLNFTAWYQAARGGIVDFNFADFYSSMARYRADAGPRIGENLAWYPEAFRWEADGGASYDYFVVKSNADVSGAIFKDKLPRVELVARSGWWWLYRNVERSAASH
jgi:hypothetical protein